jgi:hypothetical protein
MNFSKIAECVSASTNLTLATVAVVGGAVLLVLAFHPRYRFRTFTAHKVAALSLAIPGVYLFTIASAAIRAASSGQCGP